MLHPDRRSFTRPQDRKGVGGGELAVMAPSVANLRGFVRDAPCPSRKKGKSASFFDFTEGFRGQITAQELTGGYRSDSRKTAETQGHNGDMRQGNFRRMDTIARPEIGRLRASVRVEIRQDCAGIADI
jgi:hypothetical protein